MRSRWGRRRTRALCRDLIRELDLDPNSTTETICTRLCEVMGRRLGGPVRLRFSDLGDTGMSGIWALAGDRTHVIIVTTTRSWVHRLFIVLHEIAHMLCEHPPIRLGADEGRQLLYPDLSPRMLTMLAGRTNLRGRDEREADRLAADLARALFDWAAEQRVRPFGENGAVDGAADDLATRAWYALGYSPRARRG